MNLKLTKTAIRELTRLYRGVLVAAFIASAFVARGANADTTIADVITNATLAPAAEAEEIPEPDASTYQYHAPDGTTKNGDVTTYEADDYKTSSVAGTTGYEGVSVVYDDEATSWYYNSTIGADSYTYTAKDKDGNAIDGGLNLSDGLDAANVSDSVSLDTTYSTGGTVTVNGNTSAAPVIDGTKYQITLGDQTTIYHLNEDGTALYNGEDVVDTSDSTSVEAGYFNALKGAYDADQAAVDTMYTTLNGIYNENAANYTKANEAYQADSDKVGDLLIWKGEMDTQTAAYKEVKDAYDAGQAYKAYNGSLSQAIDTKADGRITEALADGGAINTAIGTALANGTDPYQTATDVGSAITTALANSGDAYQTASDVSTTVSTATTMTDDGDSSTTLYHNFEEGSSVIAAIGSLDTAVDANTSAIGVLNGSGEGSVAKALADAKDYTDALATGAVQDNADAIALLNDDADTEGSVAYAVAQEASARDTAISAATTMADDGDAETTLYHNFEEGSSVIAAIESIDTNMGKIHGLIGSDGSFNGTATSTNMDGETYKGNLAVGTTVEDHLVALDNTIGIMSNLTTTEKTTVVGAINEVDAKIGTTADGTYVAAANTVGQNLNALDSALGDVRSDMASTQASNERRFAQIDRRIDKLEDKMEKGLAANNALAGLVPLDHTHTTQISAAMGGYGSSQALAIGAFHYLNDRTLLNAGVGYGGNSNMSYKVGVTFGF